MLSCFHRIANFSASEHVVGINQLKMLRICGTYIKAIGIPKKAEGGRIYMKISFLICSSLDMQPTGHPEGFFLLLCGG
jgi:hypothetical protein